MVLKSRLAIAWQKLVSLIIVIVILVVMIMFVTQSFADSEYENSLFMCNQFFDGIKGKPLYFGKTNSLITPTLQNSVSELCPSREVEVTNKNVKPAASLMKDCWFEYGQGVDIMPTTATNLNLCLYCGKVKAKEDVDDFKGKLEKEFEEDEYEKVFSKEAEVVNLNSLFVKSSMVPSNMAKEKEIYLFYQIQKPAPKPEDVTFEMWYRDKVLGGIRNFVAQKFEFTQILHYYVVDELFIGQIVRTTGGIVAVNEDVLEESEFGDDKNAIVHKDCFVIIPAKHYD